MLCGSKILTCGVIELSSGHAALVDANNAEWLSQWRWWAYQRSNGSTYAQREETINGRRFRISMHQVIVGDVPAGERIYHLNGWGLDNRRCNLITGPTSLTVALKPPRRFEKNSLYKGVTRSRPTQSGEPRWRADIRASGRRHYLGTYPTPEEAAEVWDRFSIRYYGPHAYVNFPEKRAQYIQWVQPANRPWARADQEEDDEYGSVFLMPPRIDPPVGGIDPRGRI